MCRLASRAFNVGQGPVGAVGARDGFSVEPQVSRWKTGVYISFAQLALLFLEVYNYVVRVWDFKSLPSECLSILTFITERTKKNKEIIETDWFKYF